MMERIGRMLEQLPRPRTTISTEEAHQRVTAMELRVDGLRFRAEHLEESSAHTNEDRDES